ncbi:Dipeptidyl aminopeptidase/acylaminoacyl peptidase [Alteromonadaceae bacterium Bs31]|nr:Dipeptidyl aminopeptidase/acylaminoacyl peptidase [Alteromonadaceae bacterium Bs31]
MLKLFNIFLLILFFSQLCVAKPALEEFLKKPDYLAAKISPNGKYLAEIKHLQKLDTRVLTVRDLSTKGYPLITKLGDKIIQPYAIDWATNDRMLVHVRVPNKTNKVISEAKKGDDFDLDDHFMFLRTIAMDVDGSNPLVLMERENGSRRNRNLSSIHHFLPDDKNHVLIKAYRKVKYSKYKLSLFKVNIYTGESKVIGKGNSYTYAFLNNEKGELRYRLDHYPISKHIDILEYKENEWNRIDRIELDEDNEEARTIDYGQYVGLLGDDLVYRKLDDRTGFNALWRYKTQSKDYSLLASLDDTDILAPLVSLRTNEVIGYKKDGDFIRNTFFNKKLQNEYDKVTRLFEEENIELISKTQDGNLGVLIAHGQDNPGTFYIYNYSNSKLTRLSNLYSGLTSENLSFSTQSDYFARDKTKIRGYALVPRIYQEGKKLPLVILPHGGPQARDRATFSKFAQFISTRGYLVLKPNFRGSTGYGRAFQEAGYRQWGQRMQDDLTDAVNEMIALGFVDPEKICIVGMSYGGYAALMGAIKTPELYKCAVSINGVTDLPDLIKFDKKSIKDHADRQKYLYDRIGDPTKDMPMLVANSPLKQFQKITTPVLLVASKKDGRVPFNQSKRLADKLKKNKQHVTFIQLKDAGHNPFNNKENMKTVYKETERFLSKYLD